MKVYLVGGAVRDELLGFLHPTTHEEYALARLERKVAPGYRGFVAEFSPTVTLEEDLQRRDLTINAIARADDGTLIDPHGGQRDLAARVLRHVSPAFAEDPVRILRLARFAARFAPLGFIVAPETTALMRAMVDSGEVDALVPERVWKETEKALGEPRPDAFIDVLRSCGALARLMPEVDAQFGVPQPERWHPEIDTGVHLLMTLRVAAARGAGAPVCFALLVHDAGKALTPATRLPSHPGHENAGLPLVEQLCERLRVPAAFRELALLATRFHTHVHRALELRATTVLELLEHADAFRRPERFTQLLEVCECDARGRAGLEEREYPQRALLEQMQAAAAAAQLTEAERAQLRGPAYGDALRRRRLDAIAALRPVR